MKKVFFVLFASAALSFSACSSGGNKTQMTDSSQVKSMVNEAMDSVKSATVDTMQKQMNNMADTMKKK